MPSGGAEYAYDHHKGEKEYESALKGATTQNSKQRGGQEEEEGLCRRRTREEEGGTGQPSIEAEKTFERGQHHVEGTRGRISNGKKNARNDGWLKKKKRPDLKTNDFELSNVSLLPHEKKKQEKGPIVVKG